MTALIQYRASVSFQGMSAAASSIWIGSADVLPHNTCASGNIRRYNGCERESWIFLISSIVLFVDSALPLVATITGSSTIFASYRAVFCDNIDEFPGEEIIPIFTKRSGAISKILVDLLPAEGVTHRRLHLVVFARSARERQGHRVHAVHGHGLQVRLDTGAAAVAASGNGYCFHLFFFVYD